MKLNKLSFAVRNIFGAVAVGVLVTACGSNTSFVENIVSNTENVSPTPANPAPNYGSIPASRIILNKASTQGKILRIQASDLPDNVQVLASQVVVDTKNNALESSNLQAALDTEIAVDLTTNIVGVWNIENISDGVLFGTGPTTTGRVEFKPDGSFVVLSGGFAAPGTTVASAPWLTTDVNEFHTRRFTEPNLKFCAAAASTQNYRVVDGVVIFNLGGRFSWTTVLKNSADVITLMGTPNNGCNTEISISRLTRVTTGTTPASLKSKPKTTPTIIKTALNG